MKTIIQTYKHGPAWTRKPPGVGDFIRGACHLHEFLENTDCTLMLDISQTDFSNVIYQDPSLFCNGDLYKINSAKEYFREPDHQQLIIDINRFMESDDDQCYLSTNIGSWNRLSIPQRTKIFIKPFFNFLPAVTDCCNKVTLGHEYEVLSIRTGDKFKKSDGEIEELMPKHFLLNAYKIIEKRIVPIKNKPILVMSDTYQLKYHISSKYGFMMSPLIPQHGAVGTALPVAVDLNFLKHSSCNYHINIWKPWWSGFSHYTSIIYNIPSINFTRPYFHQYGISSDAKLNVPFKDELQIKSRSITHNIKKFLADVSIP